MNGNATASAPPKERFEIEFKATGGKVRLNPTIVKKYLVSGKSELVTDTEIVMFMQLCRYQGLNPFLRDAYLIKYSSNEPATVVVGKDTFTKRAGAIPECGGFNAGVIVKAGKDTIIKRVGSMVYPGEELLGGWGRAIRKGWQEPVEEEVSLREYMRYNRQGEPTKSWREMPATMIRKVALVQVLRETFAEHYANMYSPEEMPVEPSELPSQPVQIPDSERVFVRDLEPTPEPAVPHEGEEELRDVTPPPAEEQAPQATADMVKPAAARSGQEQEPAKKPNGFVGKEATAPRPEDTPVSKKDMEQRIDRMAKKQDDRQRDAVDARRIDKLVNGEVPEATEQELDIY